MLPPVVLSIVVPALMVRVPAAVPSAFALLMFNIPALCVVPPENVLAPERDNSPAPDFINPNPPPLIIDVIFKSGVAVPFAIVKVRVAPREMGALIEAEVL